MSEFSLRLPSAICASLWCLALYRFVAVYLDQSRALTAVILLSSSLVMSLIARAATADALLNLWICLSLFDTYRVLQSKEVVSIKKSLPIYLWVGLGVLTKGPVAIVILFLVTFIYSFFVKKMNRWLSVLFNPVGWLLCLAIFLPWYVAEYWVQGQAFIDGFFLRHNIDRFASTLEGHGGHCWYYLPVSLLVFLPVTGFYVQLIARWRLFFNDQLDLFCWVWFLVVFLFFSLSNTQLPHYLLYGVTPLFILIARYRERFAGVWIVIVPAFLFLAIFLFLPEIATNLIGQDRNPEVTKMLRDGIVFLDVKYRIEIIVCMAVMLILSWGSRLSTWQKQLGISIVFSFAIIHVVLPSYGAIQQLPVKRAAEFARQLNAPVVMWKHDMPSFSVYFGRVVPIKNPMPGDVVFMGLDQVAKLDKPELIFNYGGVALVKWPE